jgi:prepilin signal peptidase PulO-like enzyme (type II secretory pathway)
MEIEATIGSRTVALGLAVWGAYAVARVRAIEGRGAVPWPEICGTAAIAACAPLLAPSPADAAARGVACISLWSAAGADARTGFLFDAVTFPAAVLTAIIAICGGHAADAAHGVLLLVGTFGAAVVLSRGRLMGLGDVKAMYALGAAFGPADAAVAVVAACLCGLTAAFAPGRAERPAQIPFGPHLAIGAAVALICGDALARSIAGAGT